MTFDDLCREMGVENIEREGYYKVFGERKSLGGHLMTSTDNKWGVGQRG